MKCKMMRSERYLLKYEFFFVKFKKERFRLRSMKKLFSKSHKKKKKQYTEKMLGVSEVKCNMGIIAKFMRLFFL